MRSGCPLSACPPDWHGAQRLLRQNQMVGTVVSAAVQPGACSAAHKRKLIAAPCRQKVPDSSGRRCPLYKKSWYFIAFGIEAIDVPLFHNETMIGSSPAGWGLWGRSCVSAPIGFQRVLPVERSYTGVSPSSRGVTGPSTLARVAQQNRNAGQPIRV